MMRVPGKCSGCGLDGASDPPRNWGPYLIRVCQSCWTARREATREEALNTFHLWMETSLFPVGLALALRKKWESGSDRMMHIPGIGCRLFIGDGERDG